MLFRTAFPIVGALALLAAFGATGPAVAQERFKAVTTFTVIADMARNVAGDVADVESITRPGAEIHNYQPTPGDILRARDADLVLWNGLNLESWFERFLRGLGDVPSAVVSDGVEPIDIGEGAYAGRPNPHAWMSEADALIYVDNIARAFADADPGNAEVYRRNAEGYKARITEAMRPIRDALASVPPEKRWLVSSEGAFSYLARDLDLREAYLWPINSDAQGTPSQVRAVIDTIRTNGAPCIFSESTISSAPAEQVAQESGATYGGVLYVDSLSEPDGPVPTFVDLLTVTGRTIAQCLAR